MNGNEREAIIQRLWDQFKEIRIKKGKEYAVGGDVNGNFKRIAGKQKGGSVYKVWHTHFTKHMDAIENFINDPTIELAEPIEGRICDVVNYALILYTLILEQKAEAFKDGQIDLPFEGDGEGSQPLRTTAIPIPPLPTTYILVEGEVMNSRRLYPKMEGQSYHHYWGVLDEEVTEWKTEVMKRPTERDKEAMRREAVQIAATMVRFIEEVL